MGKDNLHGLMDESLLELGLRGNNLELGYIIQTMNNFKLEYGK